MRYPVENPYAYEAEERRDSQRHSTATCYRHDWATDHRGGGICLDCGETVGTEEL